MSPVEIIPERPPHPGPPFAAPGGRAQLPPAPIAAVSERAKRGQGSFQTSARVRRVLPQRSPRGASHALPGNPGRAPTTKLSRDPLSLAWAMHCQDRVELRREGWYGAMRSLGAGRLGPDCGAELQQRQRLRCADQQQRLSARTVPAGWPVRRLRLLGDSLWERVLRRRGSVCRARSVLRGRCLWPRRNVRRGARLHRRKMRASERGL